METKQTYDKPDDYDLITWLCPRCYSDNIREETQTVQLDGIEWGYETVWTCGECGCEFDEPMEV